jgi:3-hydroxyisobutyrate dehydrogenase-like beta-hydroxyacid dehydrogenase
MQRRKVAVTSTGAMGSAIAQALIAAGHDVTVWNRSPGKADALVSQGATLASSVRGAVEACEVIIAVPNPFYAIGAYLLTDELLPALEGKTIVLMSSYQRMDQPQALERQIEDAGGYFVDGKIFCYPTEIGKSETSLVFSGRASSYVQIQEILSALGQPVYLGERIELAFVYECVMTSLFVAMVGGVMNGIALFERAGIPLQAFDAGLTSTLSGLKTYLAKVTRDMLPVENFDTQQHGTATTGGILEVMRHFSATFHAFDVHPHLCDGVMPVMQALVDSEQGGQDLAAMIRVFRSPGAQMTPETV